MTLVDDPRHPIRVGFGRRLADLRHNVVRTGELAERATGGATLAVAARDIAAAEAVVAGDAEVNALHRASRVAGYSLLLTQGPVAGDLREVVALLEVSAELERIADHAVSIAKQAIALGSLPPLDPPVDVGPLVAYCVEQVRDGLAALVARDAGRARAVAVRDDRLDRVYHRVRDELVERMQETPDDVPACVALLAVAHHIERIGDRVTNLAEGLVFLDTGDIVELG